MKSEPDVYSYDDLVAEGEGTWDGVRNYSAANNLRSMKVGDEAFFYHSNIGLEIVAIITISQEHFIDPTDEKARFVAVNAARDPFRAAADAYAQRLWRQVESEAGAPWFLGERFSALDIYINVMTRWRPKRGWFEGEAPRLFAIARRADQRPELKQTWRRNYP
jgi:glutathione S-transferase